MFRQKIIVLYYCIAVFMFNETFVLIFPFYEPLNILDIIQNNKSVNQIHNCIVSITFVLKSYKYSIKFLKSIKYKFEILYFDNRLQSFDLISMHRLYELHCSMFLLLIHSCKIINGRKTFASSSETSE